MRVYGLAMGLIALAAPAALFGATAPSPTQTVSGYYAAIDRGAYRTAYLTWDNGGQASGKSYTAFRDGFAQTLHTSVRVGPAGRTEGAAGSAYVTLPVDVCATLRSGEHQHFRGSYTLRRVNTGGADQPWHLYSAKIAPAG